MALSLGTVAGPFLTFRLVDTAYFPHTSPIHYTMGDWILQRALRKAK